MNFSDLKLTSQDRQLAEEHLQKAIVVEMESHQNRRSKLEGDHNAA